MNVRDDLKKRGFNTKTTTELPEDIRPSFNGLYEKHRIENSGYKVIDKVEGSSGEDLTVWSHPMKNQLLMFIEKQNGFFEFGGYIKGR